MSKFSQKLREMGFQIKEVAISHEEFERLTRGEIELSSYLSERGISLEGATKVFTDNTVAQEYNLIKNIPNFDYSSSYAYSYIEYPKTLEEFKSFLT